MKNISLKAEATGLSAGLSAGLPAGLMLCLLVGAALTFSSAAHAEANPYYLGGSLGANHVSNVYRQETNANADTVYTANLLAGLDQQIGRQHLSVDGSLQQSRYVNNTQLNNNGHSLRGVLDWSTAERISGTLSASTSRQLASYNIGNFGNTVTQVFAKNIEKDRQLQAVARVGLVTRYSIEASLTHYDQNFSLIEYSALVYHQNAGSLGLYFQANELLRMGLALRHTTGEYPRYPVVPVHLPSGVSPFQVYQSDTFTRNDIDLTAAWKPSGASKLDARLSWTDNAHDFASVLNYKGVTGALGWTWQPVNRLTLQTRLARDTGSQVNNLGPSVARFGNSLDINASYEMTSKVSLTSSVAVRHSTYENPSGARGHDNEHNYNAGARWAYSRSVSLSCQAYRAGRNSSTEVYSYSATGYGCTVQGLMY